jgi:hypothetical protein
MAPPSSDLLLLLLVTSSGAEPYPLAFLPRHRSPSSTATAQQLGLAIESHDPDGRPLPVGVVKRANRRSTRLPHRLKRSGDVPEPDGPVLIDGSAGGGGTARDGVGEVGGVVVRGASSPWGRPRGPMEILAILGRSSQRGGGLGRSS